MSKDLRAKFKVLKDVEGHINPSEEWVSRTRQALLSSISEQAAPAQQTQRVSHMSKGTSVIQALMSARLFSYMKPMLVSVFVFALATSGWIASASASSSLPGDRLWHVKLATEKTQIVLADITGNEQKNVQLQLRFAARRADEIKTVAAKNTLTNEEKTDRTEEGLKKLQKNISSVDKVVQQAAKSEGAEEKKELGKQAKEMNDATTQISETLGEVADSSEGLSDNTALTKEVVAVKQAVDEVGLDVVKVAVEGAENDEERIAAEELVEEKIVSILSDADGTLGDTAEVKELIEQMDAPEEVDLDVGVVLLVSPTNTPDIASENFEEILPPVEDSSSGTLRADETLPVASDEPTSKQTITRILEEVGKTSATVTESVAEIKLLIEAGELSAALEKAKELRKVTAASEQATIDIKQVVKKVTEKKAADAHAATLQQKIDDAEQRDIAETIIAEEGRTDEAADAAAPTPSE